MRFRIIRTDAAGNRTSFGDENSLVNAIILAADPIRLSGSRSTWVSDVIQNVDTQTIVATKNIQENGNWKLGDTFLDVFLGAALDQDSWHSYWLQPDGSITVVKEDVIMQVRSADTLPDFGRISGNVVQIPICATCLRNPADGISHDDQHRGIMPPYAMFECAACAWDAPGTVFYQNGHHDVERLRQLAREFFW
ncbi:MAG: hypothetical protein RI947_866 [Candidatus Parcubacteria bacterium]|jgi:hypothetical protein